jgi:hypothetical protein
MKNIFQLLLLTLTLSIVACNNNPTNVESNPTKGVEYKSKTEVDPPKRNDGTPTPCADSYTFAITTQEGQPVDQENLLFTVGSLTTYRITVTSKLPNFKLKAVSAASNVNLNETKTAGLWNLTLKPNESQGNQKIKLAVVLPVPKDKVCVEGISRESLVLNIGFGKPRAAVNVLDFDQIKPYLSTSTQAFTVEVNDPNIHDNETPKAPALEFQSLYDRLETLFLNAQNAVSCDPNGAKVATQTFRFNCQVDFTKVQDISTTKDVKDTSNIRDSKGNLFGHSDFLIYGVSVTGDKSVGESIGMTIQYPPSALPETPATPVKPEAPKKEDKKSKKSKNDSSKDSKKDPKKNTSTTDSKKASGDKT